MRDIENKFILILSTNILSMTVSDLLWMHVANLTVWDKLYVVNNEASRLFQLL
jgi:hypothetical protein